ncbi:hypothetical protein PFWH6_3080 [Pseudomonas fluorescens WH6]|nr:hypothetical protein PFWH6_3080 [Pseudomonas fluorescens WH6]
MHTRLSPLVYLGFACSAALAPWAQVSYAACTISPTAGDDAYPATAALPPVLPTAAATIH